jgi:hypothetical protein
MTNPAEEEKSRDASLEETFQIQVNNVFIDRLEHTAGRCIFSVLSILTNTHPASDSFVSFSAEEISRLDVAGVVRPGTLVAVAENDYGFYCSRQSKNVEYGHCKGCDRSRRTILVEFANAKGAVEKQIPWSWISGMEDTSKRHSILSHHAAAKSAAELDKEPASIGHLILVLRWSRHMSKDRLMSAFAMCIADRAAILLSTEVSLHDELHKVGTTDEERRFNGQLLDLFENALHDEYTEPEVADQITKLPIDEGILSSVRVQLRNRLEAACAEREEEQKLWEQQNSGWDTSFWGGSHKREGRRSPFRAFNRMPSIDSLQ